MTDFIWIESPEALAIHARQLDEHGGASGLRIREQLDSALARQRHAYGTPDLCDLAATYTAAIIGNHPFVDGNKRTGFVVGALFLELNGLSLTASEEDASQVVLSLAAGELDEVQFAAWLRGHCAVQ